MIKALNRHLRVGAALLILPMLGGCVHEWPDTDATQRRVRLHFYYDPPTDFWDQHEMVVNRSDLPPFTDRYHIKVYREGDKDKFFPVAEYDFTRGDNMRRDFTTGIDLPPGDYELFAWSDWAGAESAKSFFFDTSDFSNIIYSEPYNGNNELRDAFRGEAKIHVDNPIDAGYDVLVEVPLERPLARYEFISTDLREFIKGEETRGMLSFITRGPEDKPVRVPDFSGYRIKMIYTGYMPSTYNNITDKPTDSRTGMSYDAEIKMVDEDHARLGFDYVLVNGKESSVAVALQVYDPTGELIAQTNTINVETKRNRNTSVYGRFLTSKASGGVGINPDYDGDFNIEIK